MIKRKIPILILIFIFLNNCSFDDKTGIWSEEAKEKRRVTELEKKQKAILKVEKIYTSENIFQKEIPIKKNITLSKDKNISSWTMSNLNHQNFLGNIYLSGINNTFLKKKIGKDKFSNHKTTSHILVLNNKIILSDDRGTIYSINKSGRVLWKKNIYKKAYKKIYKNLVFSIYENNIYVADNIGFVYSINLTDGNLIWIRNYQIPFRSNIKVYENKIFLINQDNKIFCLDTKDGALIWNILSISSFIKSQNLLSIAITQEGDLLAITSSADVYKINISDGTILWSRNTADSLYADATDFFISSEIISNDNKVFFSSGLITFSLNLDDGKTNWTQEAKSVSAPIISGENIFIVTDYGYLIILDKNTGEIISSSNILKILKKRKQKTKITGFVMGSGKIYSSTSNGFLIVSSSKSGKAENFKKIGSSSISSLIISDGSLYMLTDQSKILVFN